MLEELVKSNAALTKNNAKLPATNTTLTKKKRNILQEVEISQKAGGDGGVGGGGRSGDNCGLKHYTKCKQDVYHAPDNSFELAKNPHLRPSGWASVL